MIIFNLKYLYVLLWRLHIVIYILIIFTNIISIIVSQSTFNDNTND